MKIIILILAALYLFGCTTVSVSRGALLNGSVK